LLCYDKYKRNLTTDADMKNLKNTGFTLVELSIVIVIIGFLVAGISAGSNMVKQAQLRSVITDMQSFQTAYNGFVGRYNAAPGDLNVASSYWPAGDGSQCVENGGNVANCNGDGNGVVRAYFSSDLDEVANAWKHMQLSGFINSGISVIPDSLEALSPGTNVPASKISSAGYIIVGSADLSRVNGFPYVAFGDDSKNYIYLGKVDQVLNFMSITQGALKAEDAFNLDAKMDDGIVDGSGYFTGFETGNFKAIDGSSPAFGGACRDADTYTVSNQTTACLVGMALN